MAASFVTPGLRIPFIPLLIFRELLRLGLRPLALGLRIVVNLSFGQLLLGTTAKLIAALIIGASYVSAAAALVVGLCLVIFELAVAVLQAYIFFALVSLYWQEEDPACSYSICVHGPSKSGVLPRFEYRRFRRDFLPFGPGGGGPPAVSPSICVNYFRDFCLGGVCVAG